MTPRSSTDRIPGIHGRTENLAHISLASDGTGPAILLIHSWWGLTRSFTAIADRLAQAGFVVGCADLYGGRTAADEDQARALRRSPRKEPMYLALRAALDELRALPETVASDPAVLGFSMGGHWAMWLAQHPDPPVAATVLFYAARGGDFSALDSPVMAHFADSDEFVSSPARRGMERGILERGVPYECYDYPGTGHWFAEPEQPAYDDAATTLALERTVIFLRRYMRAEG